MNLRIITTALVLCLSGWHSHAQSDWTPSVADFIATYDSFPDPDAVIQYESGKVIAEPDGMTLTYTVRMQILKESAKEYATRSLSYDRRDGFVRIKDARSCSLTETGDIEESKLPNGDIFKERVTDDIMSVSFTLPDVKVGSIISYTYERKIPSPYSFTWQFQSAMPALVSEFEFVSNAALNYSYVFLGAFSDRMKILSGSSGSIYQMKNIPASRTEPFVPNEGNYEPRIRFQLASYYNRNTLQTVEVIPSWPKFGKTIMEIEFIRDEGKKKRELRDLAESISGSHTEDIDKARAIFEYIQNKVVWNENYELLPQQAPIDVLESRSGSSADINALLYHLLRLADIDAYPAVVGTRDHSIMIPQFPITGQFNTLLVYAEFGEDKVPFALDATNPNRPFDLPDRNTLNRILLVIDKSNTQWVEMPVQQVTQQVVNGFLKIDETGRLSGEIKLSHTGYMAVRARTIIKEGDMSDFWEWRMDEEFDPAGVTDYHVMGLTDPDSALVVTATFDLPGFGMAAGDYLYIQPIFMDKFLENPFKDSVRMYPIDFSYPGQSITRLTYMLPQGYTVDEAPANSKVILPNEDMSFLYMAEDQVISCSVVNQFALNRTFYQASEQDMLQMMYDEIIQRHGQQMVLKKSGQ